MGVFGAVFGCRGVVGFSGPLLGASSGVVGFKVATLSRLVREKVRPARSKHPKIGVFCACWASFFAEVPVEGLCWASFFALIGPAPRSCRRRGARGRQWWGFCSIRSWLAVYLRRVAALMMQFPPFGDGEPPTYGGMVPTVQTTSVKNAENRALWMRWSAFWAQRCQSWWLC